MPLHFTMTPRLGPATFRTSSDHRRINRRAAEIPITATCTFHELHSGCDDPSTPATAKTDESKKTSTANGEQHMTHCTMRSGHHCISKNESTIAANEHPAVAKANCMSLNRTARRRHQHRRVDTKHQTGICNPTSMQPLSHYLRTPRLCRRLL